MKKLRKWISEQIAKRFYVTDIGFIIADSENNILYLKNFYGHKKSKYERIINATINVYVRNFYPYSEIDLEKRIFEERKQIPAGSRAKLTGIYKDGKREIPVTTSVRVLF